VSLPKDNPIKWTTKKIITLLTPSICFGVLGALVLFFPPTNYNQESWQVILGVTGLASIFTFMIWAGIKQGQIK